MDTLKKLGREPIISNGIEYVILSRELALTYECDVPHLLISIYSDDEPDAPIFPENPHRIGFIQQNFHDVDRDVERLKKMTPTQARELLGFLKEHKGNYQRLVVHCEAGISRSSAIAAAIMSLRGEEPHVIFERFHPNRYVYDLLLQTAAINYYLGKTK